MRYEITISHEGMNKIRRISGADKWLVEEKARAQKATWDEQWAIRVEKERQRSSRERAAFVKDSKKKLALDRTEEAQGILTELRSVLGARKKSLKIWSKLKDTASFSEPAPIEPATPLAPPEPDRADRQYQPKLGLLDKFIASRRRRKQGEALARLEADRLTWRAIKMRLDQEREIAAKKYQTKLLAWEDRKATFIRDQEARNLTVEQTRGFYKQKQPEAVEIYNDFLLSESRFPECCPDEHEIRFLAESGILVTDYRLPALADLPTLKQVRYVVTKDVFEEGHLRPQEVQALYDALMYQICLRVISEIFEHDSAKAIAA